MKVFVIDNLKPVEISSDDYGSFCIADSYIVLVVSGFSFFFFFFLFVGDFLSFLLSCTCNIRLKQI